MEEVLERDPTNLSALRNKALACRRQGDFRQALDTYQRIRAIEAATARARLEQERTLARVQELEQARARERGKMGGVGQWEGDGAAEVEWSEVREEVREEVMRREWMLEVQRHGGLEVEGREGGNESEVGEGFEGWMDERAKELAFEEGESPEVTLQGEGGELASASGGREEAECTQAAEAEVRALWGQAGAERLVVKVEGGLVDSTDP